MGGLWSDYGFQQGTFSHAFRANTSFGTPVSRQAIEEGIMNFTVVGYGDCFRHIEQRRAGSDPYDFCWFRVTPPNESGYCCVGAERWELREAMKCAKVNVAAVNRHLPRTYGDTWIHVSEIDHFVEDHEPVPQRYEYEPMPAAVAIAKHVSGLVRDRDTLQIGTGSTSGTLAQLGAFDDKPDLGFFSEMSHNGLIELVEKGVITSKYATVRPNKFVTTGLSGGGDEYAYVDNNPFFEFYNYAYMLNPAMIGQNENMVAINNALSIDLRGQNQPHERGSEDLVWQRRPARVSHRRVSIQGRTCDHCIAVYGDERHDFENRPAIPRRADGDYSWDLADTVVTEFGVAELIGKTMRQRAQALIDIAHPDHRAELRKWVSKLL